MPGLSGPHLISRSPTYNHGNGGPSLSCRRHHCRFRAAMGAMCGVRGSCVGVRVFQSLIDKVVKSPWVGTGEEACGCGERTRGRAGPLSNRPPAALSGHASAAAAPEHIGRKLTCAATPA